MRWVAEKVSDHKRLRGGIVLIRAIPKSPSGKILRKELRALAKTEREDAVKSTRPAKL
jgi:acyl-coenzyme A synthetase/AMP-(fatty) acid ligase